MSIGSISASLASSIAFSAVPPMPMPSMPGGHQPAPMVGSVFTTQSTIESEGLSITNLDLFSEPPPLAAIFTSTVLPGTRSKCTTAGVLSRVLLRLPAGSETIDGAQRVVRMQVRAPHAFVDHVADAHRDALPLHVHADFHEGDDDAGVLADRALAFGAHARVGEDLRDRVLGGGRLLRRVGLAERLDVVDRVVVGDVLQRVGDARDEVRLLDRGHGSGPPAGNAAVQGVGGTIILPSLTGRIRSPAVRLRRRDCARCVTLGRLQKYE